MSERRRFKLRPSDLSFLWDECRRCFYEQCRGLGERPRVPMASVYTRIDAAMRGFYEARGTRWISPTLPGGQVDCKEIWLTSSDIEVPGRTAACWVSGKTDCVLCFDDGTYGIVDFKTQNPGDQNAERYARQLSAYAYCMEHPGRDARGRPSPQLGPVSTMGLLCFEPGKMQMLIDQGPLCLLQGRPVWKPRPWDESAFVDFLGAVMGVLESDDAPEAAERCAFCAYRRGTGRRGLREAVA